MHALWVSCEMGPDDSLRVPDRLAWSHCRGSSKLRMNARDALVLQNSDRNRDTEREREGERERVRIDVWRLLVAPSS